MSKKINRRSFLKGAAAGGLGLLILKDSRLAFGYEANEKLDIAMIGCGGRGGANLKGVADQNIVALCDTNDNTVAKAAENHPNATKFADFRVMLDTMGKSIDAVVVSTPDHTHAVAAMAAIKMGKHVYCEKPLTHTIYEARMLRDAARKYGVATQMGNQGTSNNGLREAVEVVRSGALGHVYEVHVWSDRPIWPQGVERPAETPAVPSGLHWDLWLGPAPNRPYNPAYEPFKWRGWLDFGTGALGDMGCHTLNMPFMALDLKNPVCVQTESLVGTAPETFPKQSIIRFTYKARGDMGPVRLKWYDGGLKPSPELFGEEKLPGNGFGLVGENGFLMSGDAYGGSYKLLPAEKFDGFKKPVPTLQRSPGHYAEWINACKGGEPAMSNFDYASALTETILLGSLAIAVGEPIYWDAEHMKAINCPKADQFINPAYRAGWSL